MKMRRAIERTLDEWKVSENRNPLLIYGARQVGKTYLIKEIWGKGNFQHVIYIDFRNDAEARKLVKNYPNPKKIMQYLSLRFGIDIDDRTLLFFDEIQEAMQILTAAKYFAQDFRNVPIIMTGSLVRVKLSALEKDSALSIRPDPEIEKGNQDGRNNFLYPVGKIDKANMYPLTFNEFLFSYNQRLHSLLEKTFSHKEALPAPYHQMALDAFSIYLQIGGLPEAVSIFLSTGSVLKARNKVETIFGDYLADMSLYQISNQTIARTRMVFQSIYLQLSKENKNFKITKIEEGKRYRDYLSSFDWLSLARLAYKSELVKERVTLPLTPSNESLFRVYLPDCGLFAIESQINPGSFSVSLKENTMNGIFFENYVATELKARDIPLLFWKGKRSSEFEFLLNIDNTPIPVDVKKNRGSLGSLEVYRSLNSKGLAIKISANNYGFNKENKLLTLPYYYLGFFLDEEIQKGTLNVEKNL